MSSERVPTPASVWEFHPASDRAGDDLVRVTYENGRSLYLTMSEHGWIVDQSLMPSDLRRILQKYDGEELRLQRIMPNNNTSGHIGHPLAFRIWAGEGSFYGRDALCTSMFYVKEIKVVSRAYVNPSFSEYRSGIHIDWCG